MRSTESGFSDGVYFAASLENLAVAEQLLETGQYVIATYIAGVAVECLLLAYQMRAGVPHDAKHDLYRLAYNGNFWDAMPSKQRVAISAALGEVVARWRNNHRYRSEEAFRNFLTRNRLFVVTGSRTTRQDVVQYNAALVYLSAVRVIESGITRW